MLSLTAAAQKSVPTSEIGPFLLTQGLFRHFFLPTSYRFALIFVTPSCWPAWQELGASRLVGPQHPHRL